MNVFLTILPARILLEYFNSFFEKKPKIIFSISWAAYLIVQLGFDLFIDVNPYASLAVITAFIFCVCMLAYTERLYKKIIYTVLYITLWLLSEIGFTYIFMFTGLDYIKHERLGSISSKLLLLLLVRMITIRFKVKKNKEIPLKYWIFLIVIPICSIGIVVGIFSFASKADDSYIAVVSFFVAGALMFINFIIYFIYDKIAADFLIEKQNMLFEQQLELFNKQVAEREDAMLDFRKVKHDMKNHLIYLREMTDNNNKEKMVDYLDRLIKDAGLEKKGICKSSNIVIDALINYKYSMAQKEGITFEINVAVPYVLPYDDGDICIILGNALDNAIEGAARLVSEEKYIKLAIGTKKNVLCIVIKNSFDGVMKKDRYGRILTSKNDAKNHGLGILSIEKAAEKYNGEAVIEAEGKEFQLTVLLYTKAG